MEKICSACYISLESFVKDIIRFEEIIEIWEIEHPGYKADILTQVSGSYMYKISVVICKRP